MLLSLLVLLLHRCYWHQQLGCGVSVVVGDNNFLILIIILESCILTLLATLSPLGSITESITAVPRHSSVRLVPIFCNSLGYQGNLGFSSSPTSSLSFVGSVSLTSTLPINALQCFFLLRKQEPFKLSKADGRSQVIYLHLPLFPTAGVPKKISLHLKIP